MMVYDQDGACWMVISAAVCMQYTAASASNYALVIAASLAGSSLIGNGT
jgi:hypothetical protein